MLRAIGNDKEENMIGDVVSCDTDCFLTDNPFWRVKTMARKQATPEQQQKAAERRERFRKLVKAVGAMSEDERASFAAQVPGILTVEGRLLSVNNSCLCIMQLPNVSMVGGFQQWLRHGRAVRKGESGLMIWIPTERKAKTEPGDSPEEQQAKQRGFVMGYVFDVSQTEPKEQGAELAAVAARM